jgi:ATP-dependent Clp protease protease subunit
MIGNIYITGEIGVDIDLRNVIKQVQDQKDALEYNVYINSIGGFVEEGFDIYNYLISLKKPINTIGIGIVASIATVIFLAGGKRKLNDGTQFMIHNPSGGINGTSDEISNYNKILQETENSLIKFYAETTGLEKEALIPLLRNETFLTIDEAISFGFANEKSDNIKASFKIKNNNINKMENLEEQKSMFTQIMSSLNNVLKKFKIKNIMLIDANGIEINFPSVEEGLNPVVGDLGEIEGKPVPDGTYIMPSLNNVSVTFVGGAITEIVDKTELINLITENESLKKQLSEAFSTIENSNKNLELIKNDLQNFKNEIKGKFNLKIEKEVINQNTIEISDRKKAILNKISKK